jgi:hypothetical protein
VNSPSRGSTETAVWTVEIDPGTPVTPHSPTREEGLLAVPRDRHGYPLPQLRPPE